MKKIISILVALSAVLSLVSCSVDSGKTTAEKLSEAEVERSRLVEESIQAEVERSEEVADSVDKIGKTQKNKRIVVSVPFAYGKQYQVYVINRKGICDEVLNYYYYDSVDLFELNNEKQKEETLQKKIDSDASTRMIVFKSEYNNERRNRFDSLYEMFSGENFVKEGYVIIE